MLPLQYARGHEYPVEKFCTNEYCKEKRLFCFEQCSKIESLHGNHNKDTEKKKKLKLCEYLKELSQQCNKIVEEIEIQFSKMQQHFKQFKSGILATYSIMESDLLNLNSNEISKYFKNRRLADQFIEITDKFIQIQKITVKNLKQIRSKILKMKFLVILNHFHMNQ
ncbi:unnamed protein product [Paramecium octaurelia]|uniref:Uncharacterized protein n=1 Tax=Paramecium octaurelia TaxID=43137 RepID=A0A8S1STP2_PAROT|nr:unnamed protein product [Paramecium octaurelia]